MKIYIYEPGTEQASAQEFHLLKACHSQEALDTRSGGMLEVSIDELFILCRDEVMADVLHLLHVEHGKVFKVHLDEDPAIAFQ